MTVEPSRAPGAKGLAVPLIRAFCLSIGRHRAVDDPRKKGALGKAPSTWRVMQRACCGISVPHDTQLPNSLNRDVRFAPEAAISHSGIYMCPARERYLGAHVLRGFAKPPHYNEGDFTEIAYLSGRPGGNAIGPDE
jgi:hypothetical protein